MWPYVYEPVVTMTSSRTSRSGRTVTRRVLPLPYSPRSSSIACGSVAVKPNGRASSRHNRLGIETALAFRHRMPDPTLHLERNVGGSRPEGEQRPPPLG